MVPIVSIKMEFDVERSFAASCACCRFPPQESACKKAIRV